MESGIIPFHQDIMPDYITGAEGWSRTNIRAGDPDSTTAPPHVFCNHLL